MNIKCIITDNDFTARKDLKDYIGKIDFLTLVGECENAIRLNNLLKTQPVDLLFLEIDLPYLSGLAFLKGLPNPPKVIFTTAHDQYAIEGFELGAVDYLLKPISFERFFKAVNKLHGPGEEEKNADDNTHIFIKNNKQYKKLIFDDILYIQGMDNYVVIHTVSSKEIVHITMKNLMESLPAKSFIQVHRSFIVNIQHIRSIEGNQLLIGKDKILVARGQREEVFKTILNNRLISK